MFRIFGCLALLVSVSFGCKGDTIVSAPGEACSAEAFCDQDKGLFCQEDTKVCDCEGMFKWDPEAKICAETDVAETLRTGEKKCRAGDPESCYKLGRLYLMGAHVAKEDGTAVNYFKGACEAGLQKACDAMVVKQVNALCSIYLKCDKELGLKCGDNDSRCICTANTVWDVEKSRCEETEEARNLRENTQKCLKNEMEGCHKLAQIYTAGAGVPKDEKKALSLFQKACGEGYKPSCNFCMLMGGCENSAADGREGDTKGKGEPLSP